MLLAGIAAVLQGAGLGTPGQSLFVGAMPLHAAPAVQLVMILAGASEYELAEVRRSDFQAVCRAADYPSAVNLAESVRRALTLDRKDLASIAIFACRPFTDPFPIGREEGSYVHMGVNFTTTWRRKD
jgi:hypothetical protein